MIDDDEHRAEAAKVRAAAEFVICLQRVPQEWQNGSYRVQLKAAEEALTAALDAYRKKVEI